MVQELLDVVTLLAPYCTIVPDCFIAIAPSKRDCFGTKKESDHIDSMIDMMRILRYHTVCVSTLKYG